MRRRGWFRLWIVASAIFIPALAFWQVHDLIDTWGELDKIAIQTCVNEETAPQFDVDKCVHDAGADQTAFQHENVSAGHYWGEALGVATLFDLVLTALLIAIFFVVRWVVRGFRGEAPEPH